MQKKVLQFSDERVNLFSKKHTKKEVFQFEDERVKGIAVSRKIGAALDSFSAWTLELQSVDYRLLG